MTAAFVFRPLTRSVSIPLGNLTEPWQPVFFDARTVTTSGAPLRLKGMLVRNAGTQRSEPLTADR